jgi:hypothetical protein
VGLFSRGALERFRLVGLLVPGSSPRFRLFEVHALGTDLDDLGLGTSLLFRIRLNPMLSLKKRQSALGRSG